ncbi:hypothetical protein [Lacticaseibacillus yichunensis]|uniref:Uncharacterized protein n=1 Tax=Lacticaseibacillus yichunensis TaxID=2486015 RepID=A0ABW4CNC2_9LACO|nr:hypothetical protein [Lacticaseibacillus yichunensis]
MSEPVKKLLARTLRACLLAGLLWLGALSFGLRWLSFAALALLIFAAFCIGYAGFLWLLDHHQ